MTETPIREAAFAAIEAALIAAAMTVDGLPVTITRNDDAPAEEDAELPLLVLLDGDQDSDQGDGVVESLYRVRAILAGYVAAGGRTTRGAAINSLHAQAIRALIRPSGAALPSAITLADGTTSLWIEEGPMRVELASVLESQAPLASFTLTLSFDLRAPWGSPYITT
jgi:hypothetical protein